MILSTGWDNTFIAIPQVIYIYLNCKLQIISHVKGMHKLFGLLAHQIWSVIGQIVHKFKAYLFFIIIIMYKQSMTSLNGVLLQIVHTVF